MKRTFRPFILAIFLFYHLNVTGQWTVIPLPAFPDSVNMFTGSSLCQSSNWLNIYPLAAEKHLVSKGCDPVGSTGGTSYLYHSGDDLKSLVKKRELGGTMANKGQVKLLANSGDSIAIVSLVNDWNGCYLTTNRFTTMSQLAIHGILAGASITNNYLYIQTTGILYRCNPSGTVLASDTTYNSLNLVARNIVFITDSVGYLTGDPVGGSVTSILRTNDMGKNWTTVYAVPADSLAAFQAFPSGILYLLTKQGKIHISKNLGSSWQVKQSLPAGNYTCMRHFSETRGLAGTSTGQLYGTTDSCASWTSEISNTNKTIEAIYCFDTWSYFVTDQGLEKQTVHAPVAQIASISPQSRASLVVYPNPATGDVVISTGDSGTTLLHVRLYNGMGQLVYSVEQSGASLTLDVGRLEQGLYLLQCEYSGKKETRRLVKL
jgi:hypothetical protein